MKLPIIMVVIIGIPIINFFLDSFKEKIGFLLTSSKNKIKIYKTLKALFFNVVPQQICILYFLECQASNKCQVNTIKFKINSPSIFSRYRQLLEGQHE